MNYPIWNLPASGLLIAAVAIVHVFISHLAVGGGLFLVVTERKARREEDPDLLDYVRRLSRFFILLTLVLGAMTGVGIWFTIALVHPQATSSLINTFVWGWAVEWTFFVVEIAAAIVYYYGWDRLSARDHLRVGWVYFWAAWLSLVVINGIITFMLTPGDWISTRGFWDGLLNPTYLPSLVTRTLVAGGLAGMLALFAASFDRDEALKEKVARIASGWILPVALALPVSLWWYVAAAREAGVPVGPILGSGGQGNGAAIRNALTLTGATGYPMAQVGALVAVATSLLIAAVTAFIVLFRPRRFGRFSSACVLALGLAAMGGGEWVREDLRKPYVIRDFMFVHGARLPAPETVPQPPPGIGMGEDRFSVDALNRTGLLVASSWHDAPAEFLEGETGMASLPAEARSSVEAAAGREIFEILCASCHTLDGYNAIRPLVSGSGVDTIEHVIRRLAVLKDAEGNEIPWADAAKPGAQIGTWRDRRMPPFVGTDAERRALAVYLARVGGAPPETLVPREASMPSGRAVFEENCSFCHDAEAEPPMADLVKGLDADELFDAIGRLPELNDAMPPFEGTDEERRALAEFLAKEGVSEDGR